MEQISYDEFRGAEKLAKALIKVDKSLKGTVNFELAKLKRGLDLWAEEMEKEFRKNVART